ncbi:MAG: AtpZ/AtpI family protein [Candidatus Moranbacteria bacterium]|nr:AtpZ/AtpI family protein [Candidatus Moranbacteria bacterium]
MSKEKKFSKDWANAMKVFATVSSWIVGPIILAVLIGSWLDNKYQTEYFFTLTSVVIAFIMTCIGIVREARKLK